MELGLHNIIIKKKLIANCRQRYVRDVVATAMLLTLNLQVLRCHCSDIRGEVA